MNIKELIEYGKNTLIKNNIEEANLKARMLAKYILNINATDIICNEDKQVSQKDKDRYYLALIELVQGMPIQYITNNQEFMKLNFYVDENVLIPRPDTEILVEEIMKLTNSIKDKIDILDICTGSGCIGTSLAKYLDNVNSIFMSDISENALNIAKRNYEENIKDKDIKVKFIKSDMFDNIENKYDIIVSNPPYIETKVIEELSKQVRNEPYIALDGGKDGLIFYKILIEESYKYLKNNGYLCLEIGYDQKEKVINLIKQNGNYKNEICIKDLSGNDRVIIAQKS